MFMERESKDFLAGVIPLVITACVLYLLLGVEWWTTLFIAFIVGVVAGVIADRLQGSLPLYDSKYGRDLINLWLKIIAWGGMIFILFVLILEAIGLLHSPSLDAVYTGWLLILSAGWVSMGRELEGMKTELKRLDRIESRLDSLLAKS